MFQSECGPGVLLALVAGLPIISNSNRGQEMNSCNLSASWYIESLDGHKIAALTGADGSLEDRTLTASRCIVYADEMLMTFKHTELADVPQVNIIHEWRENKDFCKTIYHKAFLLNEIKQYSLTGDLIIIPDLKYEYETREEIRK